MRVAVKDACVLMDLANGGVLEAWFRLGVETHTTDLVIRQVRRDDQWRAMAPFVESGHLQIDSLSGEDMASMLECLGHLPVGIEDQSAIFLARRLEAVLLTGDRRLRLEAEGLKIEVHGVLWVLDLLVGKNVIQPAAAAQALRRMLEEGARLPRDECDQRLSEWATDDD